MEKGKAKQLLDKMQVLIEDGQNVPFAAGKVLVNKEEMLEMIEDLKKTMDPAKYVGRAPLQVENFLKKVVDPVLEANKDVLGMTAEINV